MGQLDASIVTLALPRLSRELHASVGAVEWVALTYLLVLVATVATVGRIADAVGRKLLYVYGFARVHRRLGAVRPRADAGGADRRASAPGGGRGDASGQQRRADHRGDAAAAARAGIGVQGTAQALGLALGPAIGGLLLSLGGWRLIFLVNLPAGAIGLALGWFLLPRSRSRRALGQRDRLGALLLALAVAGPLLYLSLGRPRRLHQPRAARGASPPDCRPRSRSSGRERRVADPLIDLSILRRPALSVGLSSGLVSYLALFGTLFVVPYYLSAEHVSAALIGLQLAVLPVAIGVTAPIAGRLVDRVGARPDTRAVCSLPRPGCSRSRLRHGTIGLAGRPRGRGARPRRVHPANNAASCPRHPLAMPG